MSITTNDCFLSKMTYDQNASNLVIDLPGDLMLDQNLTVTGNLLIRAQHIDSTPGVALTAKKVILVADRINFLGPIEAPLGLHNFSDSSYIKGPFQGGISWSLTYYSAHHPDFWSSLVRSHTTS